MARGAARRGRACWWASSGLRVDPLANWCAALGNMRAGLGCEWIAPRSGAVGPSAGEAIHSHPHACSLWASALFRFPPFPPPLPPSAAAATTCTTASAACCCTSARLFFAGTSALCFCPCPCLCFCCCFSTNISTLVAACWTDCSSITPRPRLPPACDRQTLSIVPANSPVTPSSFPPQRAF